jgi:hypothetical protein
VDDKEKKSLIQSSKDLVRQSNSSLQFLDREEAAGKSDFRQAIEGKGE